MTRRERSLELLMAAGRGKVLPLTTRLERLYGGALRMLQPRSGPRIFSNFVSSLDGVVSLQVRGRSGGGDISGVFAQDRAVMGLLRAIADVMVLGSGSVEADPGHAWTPQSIYPALAADYAALRTAMRLAPCLRVIVSAHGSLDLRSPVCRGEGPLLIVTTRAGARRMARQPAGSSVLVRARGGGAAVTAGAILEEIGRVVSPRRILLEGGPNLLGTFYRERLVDEQFLTLSPLLAGRMPDDRRIGLIMGQHFAPREPRWGTLADVRRGANHLFLRYLFERGARRQESGAGGARLG